MFSDRRRKWTCLNIGKVKNFFFCDPEWLRSWVGHLCELRSSPLFHIAFIDTFFSVMAITVSALSYSAISQMPPPPQPPNPSKSSFNLHLPALPAYWFSIFPLLPPPLPVLQLSPSSLTLSTVQPVSLRFFFFFFLNSVFHSLTWSGQSFSSLTRSKPQPCSELLKVRKWRCNVIEWLGNRIHEGQVWSC